MTENKIIEILMKQAHMELSQEESGILNSFRALSVQNEAFIKENQLILNNMPSFEETEHMFDAEQALAKVSEVKSPSAKIIELKPSHTIAKPKRNNSYTWMAAAMVVIGLGTLVYTFLGNQPNTLVYAAGEEIKTISLSDGSEVKLNKHSTLTLADGFGTHLRDMTLEGEAYFKVQNNDNQPFTVNAGPIKVEVIGTEFNVDNRSSHNEASVFVHEGKVKVTNPNSRTKILLTATESVSLNKKTNVLIKDEIAQVNTTSWMTQKLSFNKISLKQAIEDIENHFDITVTLDNESCATQPYTSLFNDPKPEEVLETISAAFDFQFIKSSDTSYQLLGGKCE